MARHVDPNPLFFFPRPVADPPDACVTIFSPAVKGALRRERGAAQT